MGVIFLVFLRYWTTVYADIAALPSKDDGVSHSGFFMSLIHHGNALLHRNTMEFATEFGVQHLSYYPTGPHALVAAFEWPLIRAGLLSHALALKSWLLFGMSALAPMSYWAAKRAFPDHSRIGYFLCGGMAIAFQYFPTAPMDQGGFGRFMAVVLVIPIVAYAVTADKTRKIGVLIAASLSLGFPVSFFLHTSAMFFCMVGLSIAALLFVIRWQGSKPQRIVWSAGFFASLIVGYFLLMIVVKDSGSFEQIDKANVFQQHSFSWEQLWEERWFHFIERSWFNFFPPLEIHGYRFFVQQFLFIAGFIGLTAFPRQLNIPRMSDPLLFVLLYSISCFLALMSYFAPNPALYRISLIFLNHPGRVVETAYLPTMMVAFAGVMLLESLFRRIWSSRQSFPRSVAVILASVGVCLFIADRRHLAIDTHNHLRHYFGHYGSTFRSKTKQIIDFVRQETAPDAVFLYEPKALDLLTALTGRRGIFVFNECPHHDNENCAARELVYQVSKTRLAERLTDGIFDDVDGCVPELSIFRSEVFLLIREQDVPVAGVLSEPMRVCSDLQFAKILDGFYIFQWILPARSNR
jgi:hypothetical protein